MTSFNKICEKYAAKATEIADKMRKILDDIGKKEFFQYQQEFISLNTLQEFVKKNWSYLISVRRDGITELNIMVERLIASKAELEELMRLFGKSLPEGIRRSKQPNAELVALNAPVRSLVEELRKVKESVEAVLRQQKYF